MVLVPPKFVFCYWSRDDGQVLPNLLPSRMRSESRFLANRLHLSSACCGSWDGPGNETVEEVWSHANHYSFQHFGHILDVYDGTDEKVCTSFPIHLFLALTHFPLASFLSCKGGTRCLM